MFCKLVRMKDQWKTTTFERLPIWESTFSFKNRKKAGSYLLLRKRNPCSTFKKAAFRVLAITRIGLHILAAISHSWHRYFIALIFKTSSFFFPMLLETGKWIWIIDLRLTHLVNLDSNIFMGILQSFIHWNCLSIINLDNESILFTNTSDLLQYFRVCTWFVPITICKPLLYYNVTLHNKWQSHD